MKEELVVDTGFGDSVEVGSLPMEAVVKDGADKAQVTPESAIEKNESELILENTDESEATSTLEGASDYISSTRQLPLEVGKNVIQLQCESSSPDAANGMCLVNVVGTAHVSKASCEEVQALISHVKPEMIRIDLLHRDHPLSPLAPAEGTTFSERLEAAAKRSYDRHLRRWRGRRLSDFSTPVELKGGFGGEYVISIFFGTPPQQFTGLVDTGSNLVWIQCGPCIQCFPDHPHPVFDPSTSSSELYVPCSDPTLCNPTNFGNSVSCEANSNYCQIEYLYGDGSQIEGVLTTESMTLTNTAGPAPTALGFLMGCMNNNTGIFDNYDGIIGFGRGPISLPSQFAAKGDQNVFALCLVPYTATTTLSSALLFGTRDTTNALGLVYTPLLSVSDTFYWVNMVGVSVGGVDLGIPAASFQIDAANEGGMFFDSGTPYTYFSPAIYDPIQQRIASLITYPVVPGTTKFCFDTAGVTNPTVPSVTFHFAGVDASTVVDFDLEVFNAYVPLSDVAGNTMFCLAMMSKNSGGHMILGSIAMANHYMEHDVVNMRLGWVSKDCTV